MTRVLYAAVVATMWVLAWGSLSPANVLGGLAVAGFLMVIAPDTWPPVRRAVIRPLAIAHLLGYVIVKAFESNYDITRAILARRARTHTAVLAIPLPECSEGLVTLIANIMALTPGTMPLEVTRDPTVIYVHVLQVDDVEASRAENLRLATLAYRAFAPPSALTALQAAIASPETHR